MGAQNAKSDLENYRAGYPDEVDDPDAKENLRFYKGERASIPDGDYIDEIHKKWKGKYGLLERHHGYIQWLFPIREHGMNYQSQKLQKHEIEGIKADPVCLERLLKSYELMLDFYGMVLVDRTTGQLARSNNYKERYHNLNTSGHNYLRITRILKCLGEMGFEHLKLPFLEFLVEEVYVNKELRNVRTSLSNYWSGTLRDDDQRAAFLAKIESYEEKERASRGTGGYGGSGGTRTAYGAGGGYGGYGRVSAEERYRRDRANAESSSDSEGELDSDGDGDAMEEDEPSDEEGLTVAEKAKRRAARQARTVAEANKASSMKRGEAGEDVAGEKDGEGEKKEEEDKADKKEEEKTEEKEEEKKEDQPLGPDARCNQGAAAGSLDFGNESVGTQELDANHDIIG